jgi:hypothetical protein
MEKFMLIFKGGFYEDRNLSPEESQARMQKWYKWVQDLTDQGKYVGGEPLLKGGKILSSNQDKIVVTDGPFPEAKELVGGFFIINAKDINEASEIAKSYPDFDLDGRVEVRPVMKIGM